MQFTNLQKELILEGLEQLLIQFTTKCNGSYRYDGLCDAVRDAYRSKIYFKKEILLLEYIRTNKPYIYIVNKFIYGLYYWNPRDYEPRIKYLIKHINKLKKELNK